MKAYIFRILVSILLFILATDFYGQSGPGGVGDNTNNQLWLRASDIDLGNNEPIEIWADTSGNDHDATQSIYSWRPVLKTNFLNGFNAVKFDGDSAMFYDDITDYDTRTVIVVYNINDSLQEATQLGQVWGYYDDNLHVALDARNNPGTWSCDGNSSPASTGKVSINSGAFGPEVGNPGSPNWTYNSFQIASTEFSSTYTLTNQTIGSLYDQGANFQNGEHQFGGYIAEIIVYNDQLNNAERIIIENYLAAKYDITLSSNDHYAYESTHYNELAGIGNEGGSSNLSARSANMLELKEASSLNAGDYLLFAHDGKPTDSWTTDELPVSDTSTKRIEREWKIDETGDLGTVSVSIFSDNLPSLLSGYTNYVLWVDDDGDFSEGATAYPLAQVGATTEYKATNVEIADGNYITFGCFRPIVYFSDTVSYVFEDTGTVEIEVTLNGPIGSDLDIDYQDLGTGSATLGNDYTAIGSGTATIIAGDLTTTISIDILDDDPGAEDDETIILDLSNPSMGELGKDSINTITIHDDDKARKLFFLTKNQAIDEDVGTYDIIIKSTDTPGIDVDVDYLVSGTATGGGQDYTLADGTATIPSGKDTTHIKVIINDDELREDPETIKVMLTNPLNANITDTNYITTDTIIDEDADPDVRFEVGSSSGGEDISPVYINVALSAMAGREITVDYAFTDLTAVKNDDYSVFDGTLTFEEGSRYDSIEVTIINNPAVESDEQFRVTLSNPTNAHLGVITNHTFTIEDDDTGGKLGPGGVGDSSSNIVWFRAGDLIGSLSGGDGVSVWPDTSGHNRDLEQASADNQPTFLENQLNGQPVLSFDGDENGAQTDYLDDSTNVVVSTIIAVFYEDETLQGHDDLAQLWGSYDDMAHLAADGRNNAIENGFSFDGLAINFPEYENKGRYGLDGRPYGDFGDGANYYPWQWDTWHIAMSELDSTRAIQRQVIGDLRGIQHGNGDYPFGGKLAEVIAYNSNLNLAQQIIINNYLAAKYDITLKDTLDIYKDYYDYDAIHYHELAGIGRIDYDNIHEDAQSGRMFRVFNASNLTDEEFLLFAHDSADITAWTETEVPADEYKVKRIAREWRVDEEGDVGTISIGLDTSLLPAKDEGYYDYVVWVDSDDGDFTSNATRYEMAYNASSGYYVASNVNISDGDYVTFGVRPIVVQFDYATLSGMESYSPINLSLSLSHASPYDLDVDFTSDEGTADATDFSFNDTTLTIPAGTTTATVPLEIVNDSDEESSETLEIIMSTPANCVIGSVDTLEYTIIDDDGLGWSGPGGVGSFNNQVDVWVRSTDSVNLTNGDKVADGDYAWKDQVNGIDAYQDVADNQPTYYSVTPTWNNRPVVFFDRDDDNFLKFPNNEYMNTASGAQTQRTIIVAFRTSTETYARQVIFEEGAAVRGLNIYIEQDSIYFGGWNKNNDDGGATTPWDYISVKDSIAKNKPYFAILQFDFQGVDGEIRGSINGKDLGALEGAGKLFAHGGNIGLGGMNNGSCFEGDDCDGGNDHYFDGFIAEFVSGNIVFNDAQLKIVHNYLAAKYGIELPPGEDIYDYNVNHGYQVFGIGQENDTSHSISQGHGLVKIDNPSAIGDGKYMLAGHDGGAIDNWGYTDIPDNDSTVRRIEREWRVDKQGGDIGTVHLGFDTTFLQQIPSGYSDYVLLIDDDGDFTEGATVKKMSHQSSDSADYYSLSSVDFTKGDYFTIGVIRPSIDFVLEESDGYEPSSDPDTTYYVQVRQNFESTTDNTVDWFTSDGTANEPGDYDAASGTLTFEAGSLLDSIPISVNRDVDPEDDETVSITLQNPDNGISLKGDSTHTFTIKDVDRTLKVQFALADSANTEDTDTIRFNAHLTEDNTGVEVKVHYRILGASTATGDSTDYKLLTADSLQFASGDTLEEISFQVIDDLYDEPDETIIFQLYDPVNANLGDTTEFTYTIQDNDAQPTIGFSTDSLAGKESISPALLEVVLSNASGNEITVDYTAIDGTATGGGSDYNQADGTLTFEPGDDTLYIQTDVFDDVVIENDEDFAVIINNVSNATFEYGTDDTIIYTIYDNDELGWDGPGGVGGFDDQIDCWLMTSHSLGLSNNSNDEVKIGGSSDDTRWKDQANHGLDAYQNTADAQPWYKKTATWNDRPVIQIESGEDQFMEIADNEYMNTASGPQNKRTLIVAFRPATNITDRQVIYEEGAGWRGLNIYIENDSVFIGGYNNPPLTAPDLHRWDYRSVTKKIEADKPYIAILQFDFNDFGVGSVSGHLNGEYLGEITGAHRLYPHGGDIGLGGQNGGACYEDYLEHDPGDTPGDCEGGDRNFFKGYLAEFVSGNIVYNDVQLKLVKNYFASKFDMELPDSIELYEYDINHGYQVFGIGKDDAENRHYVAKGKGIIKIDSPSNLDPGRYLMIGHDNGGDYDEDGGLDEWLEWDEIDVPNNSIHIRRVAQEWRVDKSGGDIGSITLRLDTTQYDRNNIDSIGLDITPVGYEKYLLMIDDDGDFTDATQVYEMEKDDDSPYYSVSDVDFDDGDYFTIGVAKPSIEFQIAASDDFEPITPVNAIVNMNFIPRDDYTIQYKTSGISAFSPDDYDSVGLTDFTFQAGQLSDTISVAIVNDTDIEPDESFEIILDNQNYPDVEIGADTIHTYTIHDDDITRKVQFTIQDSSGNEGDYDLNVRVHLSERDDSNPTTIDYSVTGGTATDSSDYTLPAGTITFPAGDTVQPVPDFKILADIVDEPSETIIVTLTNPNNCGLGDTTVYTYTINDDDDVPDVQFEQEQISGTESFSPVLLELNLGESGYDISVDYYAEDISATGGGQDYTLKGSGTLTIPAGTDSINIEVDIFNDIVTEDAESFRVIIENPSNATINGGLGTDTITYTIYDDDGLGIRGPGGVGNNLQYFSWLDASRESYSDGDDVTTFNDQSSNGNDAYNDDSNEPDFVADNPNVNGKNSINFNGTSEYFKIDNSDDINTADGAQTLRTIIIAFRPTNTSGRRVLYEEGAGTRGLNVYIEDGYIYCGGWNFAEIEWGYTSVNASVSNTTAHYVILEMNDPDSVFRGYLDGDLIGENQDVDKLYPHGGDIRFGCNGSARYYDGSADGESSSDPHYYQGDIMEFLTYNLVPNEAQKKIIANYFTAKYDISIDASNELYDWEATHSYQVFGIGQEDADNQHVAAQGPGIVKIDEPQGLDNGEYLLIGHDNGAIDTWNQIPNDSIYVVDREWRNTETGDIAEIRIGIDSTTLPAKPAYYDTYVVLTYDGSDTTLYPMLIQEAEFRIADGVVINHGEYFKIGVARNRSVVTTGNWHNPNSWLTKHVPDEDETAIISDGHTINLDNDVEVGTIKIGAGAKVNVNNYDLKIMEGEISGDGTLDANPGYIYYSAANDQDIFNTTYRFLYLEGSGVKKLTGNTKLYKGFSIQNGVSMDLDGYIFSLGYHWESNGTLISNGGTVEFFGESIQFVKGTGTHNFGNLEVNKSARNVYLFGNITVNDKITFTSGGIRTAGRYIYLNSADESAIEGYNESRYVKMESNGNLFREIQQGRSYFYPIGDLNNYTPVEITVNTASLDPDASISINVQDQQHPNLSPLGVTEGARINRYWQIEPTGVNSIDYDIELQFVDGDIVENDSAIENTVVAKWDGANWEFGPNNPVDNGGGTWSIDWGNLTSFSNFTVTDESAVLPIELLQFEAKVENNKVKLLWSTASEINNDYFTIEKTMNGVDFEMVTTLPGAGNSNQLLEYSTYDNEPYQGVSYYRLKQTDFDGKYEYSELVPVTYLGEEKEKTIKVFPNPLTEGNLIFRAIGFDNGDMVDIVISDIYGNRILERTFNTDDAGTFRHSLMTGNILSKGLYIVTVKVGQKVHNEKVIVR